MKSFLNKRISIGSLLVILTAAFFGITAMGAAISTVQAVLSPDVRVTLDGVTQDFTDANGNIVYPLIYNGTTYLPVRGVAKTAGYGVNWADDTRTVELSTSEFQSLMTITTASFRLPCNTWVADKTLFPSDKYENGITCLASSRINVSFDLLADYSKLKFDCYNNGSISLTVTVLDDETGKVIIEHTVNPGQTVELTDVDISGLTQLRISTTSGAIILDPMVK